MSMPHLKNTCSLMQLFMTYQFSQKKKWISSWKTRDFQIFNLRFWMNKIIRINYNFFSLSIALFFKFNKLICHHVWLLLWMNSINNNLVVTYNFHFNVALPLSDISRNHLTAIHSFINSSYIEDNQSDLSTDPGYIDFGVKGWNHSN